MNTNAEIDGIKNVAKTMSDKDLKWQIANAKSTTVDLILESLIESRWDEYEYHTPPSMDCKP